MGQIRKIYKKKKHIILISINIEMIYHIVFLIYTFTFKIYHFLVIFLQEMKENEWMNNINSETILKTKNVELEKLNLV